MSAKKTASKDRANTSRKPGGWHRTARWILLAVDVIAVLALIVSAYAGMVSPLKHGGGWGIVGLTFPIVLVVVLLLAVVQIFRFRRGLWVLGAGIVLCLGPILTYCPLNVRFSPREPAPGDSTFTLLSYNVAALIDQRPKGTYDSTYNAMVSYILERDADIVCLSESRDIGVPDYAHITAAQIDSLHARYPYILINGYAQATLSKFPLEPIHITTSRTTFGIGDMGVYRVSLPGGKLMTLFNLHLQSLGLNRDDKELYIDLTELKPEHYQDVRAQLLSKIAAANVVRAHQTQTILSIIRHFGGENVVICGDFNDVPNCYAIRSFEDAGFRSVYPRIGFGPIITFHADRFYFCIDHVLYRGDFRPLRFLKGSTPISDHYPVEVRFEILDR